MKPGHGVSEVEGTEEVAGALVAASGDGPVLFEWSVPRDAFCHRCAISPLKNVDATTWDEDVVEKESAVASLGRSTLLLPAWIKAALQANDRLKRCMTGSRRLKKSTSNTP